MIGQVALAAGNQFVSIGIGLFRKGEEYVMRKHKNRSRIGSTFVSKYRNVQTAGCTVLAAVPTLITRSGHDQAVAALSQLFVLAPAGRASPASRCWQIES